MLGLARWCGCRRAILLATDRAPGGRAALGDGSDQASGGDQRAVSPEPSRRCMESSTRPTPLPESRIWGFDVQRTQAPAALLVAMVAIPSPRSVIGSTTGTSGAEPLQQNSRNTRRCSVKVLPIQVDMSYQNRLEHDSEHLAIGCTVTGLAALDTYRCAGSARRLLSGVACFGGHVNQGRGPARTMGNRQSHPLRVSHLTGGSPVQRSHAPP